MLSEHLLRSLGISDSDAPFVNLERDWGIEENPDSTPQSPSCCLRGEVVLRPWAADPMHRVQWVKDSKQRLPLVGDLFIHMATTTRVSVKECILQCGSNEECHNTYANDDGTFEPLDAKHWRAYTVVIADDPLSAISAHSTLAANARRRTEEGRAVANYLHFCFLSNPRKFDKPMRQLQGCTQSQIVAPGTAFMACQRAFAICNRYSTLQFLAMPVLPDGITTLYDFVTRYQLTTDERIKYQGSKSSMLFDLMAGALTIDPFLRTASIDKKTGSEKDYNFQLQIRSAWLLMQSRGYVRVIDPTQPDKVGRYYKVTGNIVDEINRESLMAKCTEVLTDYARSKARLGTPDFQKLTQAIRTAKTLSSATAVDLPVITLDNLSGCDRHQDHFFFRNAALRMEITPDGERRLSLIDYDDLGFFVRAPKILPWDFHFEDVWTPEFLSAHISGYEPGKPLRSITVSTGQLFDLFLMYENPEYRQRLHQIDDDLREHRISPREHSRQLRELYDWARVNRWCIRTSTSDWHQWPSFLKVVRCYANEEWEAEQQLEYDGASFSDEQQSFLLGRMINILATLGRITYRYRNPNYIHYLMENTVSDEGKAQGGSGKSRFIRTFVSCTRNVLNVDSKIFSSRNDIETSVVFNGYRPDFHDVVHVEDYERDIQRFYNYVTGDFQFRKFHANETVIRAAEAPSIVISSNYAVKGGMDDSSAGRLNLCGFSHYFHRENENLNLMERGFEVVMPDFQREPQDLTPLDRGQIILITAISVLFCMETQDKVLAPAKDLKQRNLTASLGKTFYEWITDLLSQPYNFRCPLDFQSLFESYREQAALSDKKSSELSPKAFTDKIRSYCQTNDIVYMPEVAFKTDEDRRRKSMNVKCWITKRYFSDEKIWGKNREKIVRELETVRKAICFYPADSVPETYEQVRQDFIRFWDSPDPEPYRDDMGNPITLTEKERTDWERYLASRQGKRNDNSNDSANVSTTPVQQGASSSLTTPPAADNSSLITPNSSLDLGPLEIPKQFMQQYDNGLPFEPPET